MHKQTLENTPTLEDLPTLPRHKYPLWINLFAAGIISSTIYSFTLLPNYFVVAKKIVTAKLAYQNKNYDDSIKLYGHILKTVPSSKIARIGTAEAMFAKNDKNSDETALLLLTGVKLDKKDWSRITKVMPVEYQEYFSGVKK